MAVFTWYKVGSGSGRGPIDSSSLCFEVICVYVYVCVCMYVYMYVYVYIYICIYVYMIYVYMIYVWYPMHTRLYTRLYIPVSIYLSSDASVWQIEPYTHEITIEISNDTSTI